jgi:hypothetical protein
LNASGEVARSGYVFAVYLPDVAGGGLPEAANGGADPSVDADLAETTWCCYAWPANAGSTGRRTFFVNQGGDIVATEDPGYSGSGGGPDPESSFSGAGATITGNVATGMTGRDGNFWRQVG